MIIHKSGRRAIASIGILGLVGMVGVASACTHETDSPGVTTTTAAGLAPADAANRLARARCERAAECNLFGRERAFGNKDECESAYVQRVDDALADDCPSGVDKRRMDNCIAVLRQEQCLEHLGPITALPECDKSLCAR
jgi:hypothetical protein